MAKKVLIITYYWPPAGGPGVQRVLKFAKYLPEFGWEPIILTIENGDYHAVDESLLNDVPPDLKVHKIKVFSVLDFYKKLTGNKNEISSFELTKKDGGLKFKLVKWLRANFFIPDARGGWNRQAVKLGLKIIREENPEIIFTSSPPHSLQLIGLKLKKKSGIKWVADFRDPWTDAFWDNELPRMKMIQNFNLTLERKVMDNADELITISKGCSTLLSKDSAKKFHLLYNGYDESDFKKVMKSEADQFRISYVGSISNKQNPVNFFQSIQAMPPEIKEKLCIDFYGSFDPEVVQTSLEYGSYTTFHSYISHETAVEKMINSEMLLLLVPRNSVGILTGKIYEYLATRNFILGIAPKENEIEEILTNCKSGTTISFEDDPTEIILTQFERWNNKQPNDVRQEEISKLSRKAITQSLALVFNQTFSK